MRARVRPDSTDDREVDQISLLFCGRREQPASKSTPPQPPTATPRTPRGPPTKISYLYRTDMSKQTFVTPSEATEMETNAYVLSSATAVGDTPKIPFVMLRSSEPDPAQ